MTDSKPSKSARKREQLALQRLGEELITLTDTELSDLPIDADLRAAIQAAAGMKSRGALRRQKQLIGKLMRHVDPDPIRVALGRLRAADVAGKRLFRRAERWRDRIVMEGVAAIDAFEERVGHEDDELRQLARELAAAPHAKAERAVRRKMFRRIHASLANSAAAEATTD